jgi:hypothetical protein
MWYLIFWGGNEGEGKLGKGKGVRRRGCGEWEGCEEEGESGGCEG